MESERTEDLIADISEKIAFDIGALVPSEQRRFPGIEFLEGIAATLATIYFVAFVNAAKADVKKAARLSEKKLFNAVFRLLGDDPKKNETVAAQKRELRSSANAATKEARGAEKTQRQRRNAAARQAVRAELKEMQVAEAKANAIEQAISQTCAAYLEHETADD
jgi:hypothetical protein